MRRLTYFVLLCLAAALMYACSDFGSPSMNSNHFSLSTSRVAGLGDPPPCAHAVNLIAGRTMDIGTVWCWIKGDSLHVLYSAEGGWMLESTQLAVVLSRADFPLTKQGSPKIGQFPLKKDHEPAAAEVHYSLDLGEQGLEGADELLIAAHAEAVLPSVGGGVEMVEGAWGEGVRFVHRTDEEAAEIEKPAITKDGNPAILDDGLEDSGSWAMYFTVDARQIAVRDRQLLINEILYAGSCASSFYFYDQFVELYNPSADTLYLDGIILTRQSSAIDPNMEVVDYVRAIYAFQFPGTPVTGRDYPIAPGKFVVIAADAINHTISCATGYDLSGADWECYNPRSGDYDNPDVPNLLSIHPTSTADYLISLAHNAVVIATGEEYSFDEYSPGSFYVILPLWTVIDGVEYSSNPALAKQLTVRVDAGFAGIGSVRYSARSTERMALGLDTNNSTNDFMLTTRATPGYQHAE